jgi:hypothetical protein
MTRQHPFLCATLISQDIKEGTGQPIEDGMTAVVDWDGYTIGYYGRPFEARNKVIAVTRLLLMCRFVVGDTIYFNGTLKGHEFQLNNCQSRETWVQSLR